jgi:GNAT superfamily N-acetyltransferase
MPHEKRVGNYLLTDDAARLDVNMIHRYLSEESYWAKGVPRSTVEISLKNSLCIGCYDSAGNQVGLIRAITDCATYAWLCDVFVLPEHRRHALGKAMVETMLEHPALKGLRRIALATADAHGLYAQFGFTPLADPTRHMERRNPDVYRRA